MNILIHNKPKILNNDLKEEQNKTFQEKIKEKNLFHSRFKNNFRRSQSNINIFKNNLAKKRKSQYLNSLSKIVKFARDDIIDISKINQMKLINNGIESSFYWENKNLNESFNDDSYQEKSNIQYDKKNEKEISKKDDKDILIRNKSEKLINKNKNNNMNSSYNKQLFKENEILNKTAKFKSTKFQNKNINNIFRKKNIRNTLYKFNNSTIKKFLLNGKSIINKKRNYSSLRQSKISNKKLYLEKLENYEGGIFKSAKKYQYTIKLKLKKY